MVWVTLAEDVAARMRLDHNVSSHVAAAASKESLAAILKKPTAPADTPTASTNPLGTVPGARDGSRFTSALRRAGGFTIGRKGEEVVVREYPDALAELRRMDAPRWRRPNAKGNWGIVTGVRWEAIGRSE